jgi:hypothetical protein
MQSARDIERAIVPGAQTEPGPISVFREAFGNVN